MDENRNMREKHHQIRCSIRMKWCLYVYNRIGVVDRITSKYWNLPSPPPIYIQRWEWEREVKVDLICKDYPLRCYLKCSCNCTIIEKIPNTFQIDLNAVHFPSMENAKCLWWFHERQRYRINNNLVCYLQNVSIYKILIMCVCVCFNKCDVIVFQ